MEEHELEYHLETLAQQDPDYIVDVLEISTEELLEVFHVRAVKFIKKEWD